MDGESAAGPPGDPEVWHTTCCIAGGGPAGLMLGLLLARAGIAVTVLEKHRDFFRDFRGDTIHPSTLALMDELGLLEDLLRRPHQEASRLGGRIGSETLIVADFTRLRTVAKYIVFMPQWDFLDFLAEAARPYPGFRLLLGVEATGLVTEGGRVVGTTVRTAEGPGVVRAALTVAADGRHSTLRAATGLPILDLGAPIDVLWFRLSRRPEDPAQLLGRFNRGKVCVLIDRQDYWQCGFVIAKGGFDGIRARGLPAFRQDILAIAPFLADRVEELKDWEAVKLLTVAVNRLERWWRPGLLCIGDAAHAMSPIGGVGINLAIQDAVATANLLVPALARGAVADADLARVQRRREWPTRLIQRFQVLIQERVLGRLLGRDRELKPPRWLKLMLRLPLLRDLPARLIGLGIRPEHVRTPDRGSHPAP